MPSPINWNHVPMFRIVLPFAAGICSAVYIGVQISDYITLSICALIATVLFILNRQGMKYGNRTLFGIILQPLLFFYGYTITIHQNQLANPTHFSNKIPKQNQQTIYGIGTIIDKTEKPSTPNIKYTIQLSNIATNPDSFTQCTGNLLVFVKKDTSVNKPQTLQYGQEIAFKTTIQKTQAPKNPQQFDYTNYLYFQNIYHTAYLKSDSITPTNNQYGGNYLIHRTNTYRDKLLALINNALPQGTERSVAAALILGHKEDLDQDITQAYIQTGAMHILAVSGMHIGLLYAAIQLLFNLYKTGNRNIRLLQVLITLLIVWTFTLITGGGGSILRASVMFSFLSLGKIINRQPNMYNILSITLFTLCSYNPYTLFDIGFQLSYAAVWGIVYFYPKIERQFTFKYTAIKWIWQTTAIGIAAQLTTTPISLYYFHQFPTYFWLSGILVIPASVIATYAGIALFLTNLLSTTLHTDPNLLNYIPTKLLWLSVKTMNNLIYLIRELPYSTISGFNLSIAQLIILYSTLLTTAIAIQTRMLRHFYIPVTLFLLFATNKAITQYNQFQNHQITIYHQYKSTYIDLFHQTQLIHLFANPTDSLKLKYTTQNHRDFMGATQPTNTNIDSSISTPYIQYNNRLLQYDTFRMLIVDELPTRFTPIYIHQILLCNNPRLTMAQIKENYHFGELIFDGSNPTWKVQKWKQECDSLNIQYWDTNKQGAWIKNY
jgi:competence protein ComEC